MEIRQITEEIIKELLLMSSVDYEKAKESIQEAPLSLETHRFFDILFPIVEENREKIRGKEEIAV